LHARKWQNSSSYKSPYQSKEVRKMLKFIYNDKCAYCEQWLILPKKNQNKSAGNDLTVEHFRPKAVYYWLAYSWDNLLPVCYDCNRHKEDGFKILGTAITEIRADEIDTIHQLAKSYNLEEKPFFIHSDLEDLSLEFVFDKNGQVYSENERCQYVIEKCNLNRKVLNQKRKAIIDTIKADFQAIKTSEEFEKFFIQIKGNSEKSRQEFIALYRYILNNFQEIVM
jgi:uncharacterized protein (TIGR02646 family)